MALYSTDVRFTYEGVLTKEDVNGLVVDFLAGVVGVDPDSVEIKVQDLTRVTATGSERPDRE